MTATRESEKVKICDIRLSPDISPRLQDGTGGQHQQETSKRYADIPPESFEPVLVAESEDETLDGVVISGETRYMAALERGDDTISARRVAVSSVAEGFRLAVRENALHGQALSTEERRTAAKRLHADGESVASIADVLSVSEKTVSRYLEDEMRADKEEKERVLADTDIPVPEAAEMTGVSEKTVRRRRAAPENGHSGQKSEMSVSAGSPVPDDAETSPSESREDVIRRVASTSGFDEHAYLLETNEQLKNLPRWIEVPDDLVTEIEDLTSFMEGIMGRIDKSRW